MFIFQDIDSFLFHCIIIMKYAGSSLMGRIWHERCEGRMNPQRLWPSNR